MSSYSLETHKRINKQAKKKAAFFFLVLQTQKYQINQAQTENKYM